MLASKAEEKKRLKITIFGAHLNMTSIIRERGVQPKTFLQGGLPGSCVGVLLGRSCNAQEHFSMRRIFLAT